MKIKLPSLDKLLHFFFGFIISAITMIFIIIFLDFKFKFLILFTALLAGASKELYDKYIEREVFDKYDLYYTIVPGILLTIIAYLL